MSSAVNSRFTFPEVPQDLRVRRADESNAAEPNADANATGPSSNATQDATTPPQRDAAGRFAKGNAGGTGNPFARQVAALRARLLKRTTEADMDDIAVTLILLAKTGDLAAIKLLFQYTLGKPAPAVDPDRLDLEELNLVHLIRELTRDMIDLCGAPPSDIIVKLVRLTQELNVKTLHREAIKGLPPEAPDAEPGDGKTASASPEAAPPPAAAAKTPAKTPAPKSPTKTSPPSTHGANGNGRPSTHGANGTRPQNGAARHKPSLLGRGLPPNLGYTPPSSHGANGARHGGSKRGKTP